MTERIENRRTAYALAVSQHGVVARRQLLNLGISGRAVRSWSTSGRLIRIVTGVYSLGRPVTSPEALSMSAALLGGDDAVLAGPAAAAAWGFGKDPPKIDVVRGWGPRRIVHGQQPHGQLVVQLRQARLGPDDVSHLGPIPVMSPDRVLIDLAQTCPERELRRYFIEAGRVGLLTPERLEAIEACGARYRGRGRLIYLVDRWDGSKGRIRSMMEGEFRLMCAEQNVKVPLTNQRIGPYEVDCLWEGTNLVVELDSRKFHRDPIALEADAAKTRALRAMGYRVLRFTWEEITGDPERVARIIRRELANMT